jgi:hypothetical protein
MRVEDRELEPLVLQEPIRRAPGLELETVRALKPVTAREIALGDAVAEGDESAGLVRRLRARVVLERGADRLRNGQPAQNST